MRLWHEVSPCCVRAERDKERIGSGLPKERDSVKRQGVVDDGSSLVAETRNYQRQLTSRRGSTLFYSLLPGGAKRTGAAPHKKA